MAQYSKRSFHKKRKYELPIVHEYPSTKALSIYGFNPKQLSLIILVIQNSMLVLLMRYSRTRSARSDQPMYIASTAVLMAEIVKIIVCFSMLIYQGRHVSFWQPREMIKMLIPSGLYALQNNLLYIALSNLEAATFQVTYQLKILSTAVFSVLMLGRSLRPIQWAALVLLMAGVTLVQSETVVTTTTSSSVQQNPLLGLLAVLTSCVSSGFAGCYFEKLLKTSSSASMWARNLQLAICGASFSFVGMWIGDHDTIRTQGMFAGYNALTWCVVINQALGGLLVSLVVKYADNILKGFATSISIIVSGFISFCLFGFVPSGLFVMGTGVVISATVLYAK
ncbi:MAG: nucleotide-sugar transporter-domain-containing protein [Benjaminiella poitrasii]|nr:MAG: nucleotide-sugar transporter-domain-containing protein [Benjaminiella poitrasii]